MAEKSLDTATNSDLGYGQIVSILLRQRFLFLGVLASVTAVSGLLTAYTPATYESSMQLLVEPNYQGEDYLDQKAGVASSAPSPEDYATQINLMRSRQFITKTIEALQSNYPELDPVEMQKSLTLTRVVEGKEVATKIFEVTYVGNDPVKTRKVLSTLQRIYQEYNLEQQNTRLTKGGSFINSQLEVARENVSQTQGKLEQFRKTHNLIDPAQQALALTTALNQVEQTQQETRAQYLALQANFNTLQQQIKLSPQGALISSRLSQSSRYQNLLNELQKTELELAQQRNIFTDANPKIKALVERRQSQVELLKKEVVHVSGTVSENLTATEESLLGGGQLGKVDLELVSALVEAQANLASLSARGQSLLASRQQLRNQLNQFPELIAEYDRLQPEVEIGRTVVEKLLEQQQEVNAQLSRGGFDWQVVEKPLLGTKTGPNPKKNLLLGMVVGIFLGGIAAFGREAIDRVVHTSEELRQVPLPLLGIIPEAPPIKWGRSLISLPFRKAEVMVSPVVQLLDWSPFRDSVDLIYKNIHLLNPGSQLRSLTITSALAGEGKTTLILGLALSAARFNQQVLVIDADLRRPALHEYLGLSNEQGLSSLLVDSAIPPIPQRISLLDLSIDILTAGPESPDPVKLLNSTRMKELMEMFELKYDMVLLDTTPVLGMVDAVQTASLSNGIVLVGRLDRVTQSDLTQAVDSLSKLNLLGIVANGSKSYSTPYPTKGAMSATMISEVVHEQRI